MVDLKTLSVDHSYYCNEINYLVAPNATQPPWETMTDFLNEYEENDIDYNLIFRWDVKENHSEEDTPMGTFYAEVFVLQQRKGHFVPNRINSITEDEVERFVALVEKHWDYLKKIWAPVSTKEVL